MGRAVVRQQAEAHWERHNTQNTHLVSDWLMRGSSWNNLVAQQHGEQRAFARIVEAEDQKTALFQEDAQLGERLVPPS